MRKTCGQLFHLKNLVITAALLVWSLAAFSQTEPVLSPVRFFESVSQNHPFVKQAGLFLTASEKEMLISRGQYDPKLMATFNRKSFDGKEYYNMFNPEIKIPTWPGVDVKAGYERNVGAFINGEDNTPASGLQYLGVNVPLVQGLMTDVRRTALKQAKIGIQMADAEKRKQVNKVLYSAAKEYWEWYFQYQQLLNAELAFRLASDRFQAVKNRALVGELAAIDSVESLIFLQDRQIFLNQSRIDELNSRLLLSAYYWSSDEKPLAIENGISPEVPSAFMSALPDSAVNTIIEMAIVQHPELQKVVLKTNLLQLDRKLSSEMLKPQLNLQYSWLSRVDKSVWFNSAPDRNYKLGFDLSFPVFLRKERGKLGLVKTKLLQNTLDQIQLQRDIELDIRTSFNELKNLRIQMEMQVRMVENYKRLRDAEIRKFENGESTLFLINSREAKLIEAQIKQASYMAKYQKERAAISYASGRNPLLPLF